MECVGGIMKTVSKFFPFFVILLVVTGLGQELYLLQPDGDYLRFREPEIVEMSGELLIQAESLRQFGAGVTRFQESGKYYVVNQKTHQTMIVDPVRGFTLDFLQRIPGLVYVIDRKTYVSAEVLLGFLGYNLVHSDRYYAYGDQNHIKLLKAEVVARTVQLEFSSAFFDEQSLIKVHPRGNVAQITLFPVSIREAVISNMVLQRSDDFYALFSVDFGIPVNYRIHRVGNQVTIYFTHVDPYLQEHQQVADGISFYRKRETLNGSTLQVSYLEIDLDTANMKIEPQIALGGLGAREKVSDMVRRTLSYAGVNASYFDTATGFPIGTLIKNGKLLSEPHYYPRPFLARSDNGDYAILTINTEVHLNLGRLLYLVKGINKISQNADVLIFTDEFRPTIPQRSDREYVVVENGVVKSKGYVLRAPRNGFVVMMGPVGVADFVRVGDPAEYRLIVPGFPYNIEMAVEGGPRILEAGRLIPDVDTERVRYGTHIITSKTPRTVVALAPGRIVFMVIDGYQSASAGLTFEELASFLIGKGYTDAMCFDGGSSSTMVIGNRVVNNPPSGEANIAVGLLIQPK